LQKTYDMIQYGYTALGTYTETSYTIATKAEKMYSAGIAYSSVTKTANLLVNGVLRGTTPAITNGTLALNYVRGSRSLAGTAYYVNKFAIGSAFNKCLSEKEFRQLHQNNQNRFRL